MTKYYLLAFRIARTNPPETKKSQIPQAVLEQAKLLSFRAQRSRGIYLSRFPFGALRIAQCLHFVLTGSGLRSK